MCVQDLVCAKPMYVQNQNQVLGFYNGTCLMTPVAESGIFLDSLLLPAAPSMISLPFLSQPLVCDCCMLHNSCGILPEVSACQPWVMRSLQKQFIRCSQICGNGSTGEMSYVISDCSFCFLLITLFHTEFSLIFPSLQNLHGVPVDYQYLRNLLDFSLLHFPSLLATQALQFLGLDRVRKHGN